MVPEFLRHSVCAALRAVTLHGGAVRAVGRGRVLITTQNQLWPHGQALDVPVLDAEVAAGFLVSRTGDTDRVLAHRLVQAITRDHLLVLDLTSVGMRGIAHALGHSGSYLAARDLLQQITTAYEQDGDYGPEHPDTLTARVSLARWTAEAGNGAGARDQLVALLPASRRVLGAEHSDTLIARASLASWTGEAGDAAGARDQYAALRRGGRAGAGGTGGCY